MEKFLVSGGKPLKGEVEISGAKNSAVAVIPAALLVSGVSTIENLPEISDVTYLKEILTLLGVKVQDLDSKTVRIDSSGLNSYKADYEMVKKMRASYYLLGALLGRFGKAEVAFPGGCDFGFRPIDQHIKGFEALGAKVRIEHGIIIAEAERLVGAPVYMDVVSVGATINIMLAAVLAEGTTVIENAAKEPHVVDTANYLNAMGANIKGAGTDVIKIKGVDKLEGGTIHTVIPDMIEAGTFMIGAAATNGDITIRNIIPKHMESVSAKLIEMGVKVIEGEDWIRVIGGDKLLRANIKTLPYPGYPTDLQPQIAVLLCLAEGTSIINEGIFDLRFQYADELKRMGAKIKVEGRIAVIEGSYKLSGAPVKATDLRAGAAMILVGLVAEGQTEITGVEYIDRGYEDFEAKLRALGADITRVK